MPADLSWEVVLVNNASTDDTHAKGIDLWKEFGNPAPLRIIPVPVPGLSEARSAGIRNASHEYLLFCDDDNWLEPDYIGNVFARLESDPAIGVLGGENIAAMEIPAPEWFAKEQETFAVGKQGSRTGDVSKRRFLFGAGMAIRKSVWNQLMAKGYRSFLSDRKGASLSSGGDSEICAWHLREGYGLFYDESLRLRHHMEAGRLTKEYLNRLKRSMASANAILRVYHSLLDHDPTKRSLTGRLRGVPMLLTGCVAYPFSRKTGLRKLVKAQIAFGTSVTLIPGLHEIMTHYSCIPPTGGNGGSEGASPVIGQTPDTKP